MLLDKSKISHFLRNIINIKMISPVEIAILAVIFIFLILLVVLLYFYYTKSKAYTLLSEQYDYLQDQFESLNETYKDIIFIEDILDEKQLELYHKDELISDLENRYKILEKELDRNYLNKKKTINKLLNELQIVEEDLKFFQEHKEKIIKQFKTYKN